jgi:peptidoglycan/LPS O-acetylase OafA/YrhL
MDSDLSLFKRADALMIGCLLALYEEQLRMFVNRYKKTVFLSPFLIIVLIAFLNSDLLVRWNMDYGLHLGAILVPLGIGSSHGTITNLLIGLLILVSIEGKGLWSSFLNIPIVNFVGVLSYSLYLWQQLFFSKNIGMFSYFPVNILCIVAMALFSYYFIERPFVSLKNKYGHRANNKNKKELTEPGYVAV